MADTLIPPTPTADDYAREAQAQEAFGVADDQGDVFGEDPLDTFSAWLRLAGEHEPNDPNATSLATVRADGTPDVRVVLLKELAKNEGRGAFVFYSHTGSAKGKAMAANPRAALAFHWKTTRRQVRVRGQVRAVSKDVSDAYFASRSRGAQIGAWASEQSRDLPDLATLKARIAEYEARFDGQDVPRPEGWRGYEVVPDEIEFWVNRPYRLHERLLFTWGGGGWQTKRLYP